MVWWMHGTNNLLTAWIKIVNEPKKVKNTQRVCILCSTNHMQQYWGFQLLIISVFLWRTTVQCTNTSLTCKSYAMFSCTEDCCNRNNVSLNVTFVICASCKYNNCFQVGWSAIGQTALDHGHYFRIIWSLHATNNQSESSISEIV